MDSENSPNRPNTPRGRGFDWQRGAAMLFCLAAAGAGLWLGAKFLLPALMPFLIALLIAASVRPLASRIARRLRLSERTVSVILVLILLVLATLALSFGIRRLITELIELARGLNNADSRLGAMLTGVASLADDAGNRIASFLFHGNSAEAGRAAKKFDALISGLLADVASKLASGIPGLISGIVGAMPKLLLGLAVTVIASFYFALDGGRAPRRVAALLPARIRSRLPGIKKGAARTAAKYLRAYSLILLLTFAELFFGFSVLGVDYSFVIALGTALVDVLPVLGVGTVLIPWAIVCFALSDARRGAGLLILYGVVMLVRQFAEPRIVGGTLGIHPLLTLLSMYLGFRLFGVAGMILGPIAVTAARTLLPRPASGGTDTPGTAE